MNYNYLLLELQCLTTKRELGIDIIRIFWENELIIINICSYCF